MTKEAVKLALETLESSRIFVTSREKIKHPEGTDWYDERISAIKEALAQPEFAIGDIRALRHRIHELEGEVIGYKQILDAQPKQEPVAWIYRSTGALFDICPNDADEGEFVPLYTTPPQRKPLTDEEVEKIIKSNMSLQMNLAGIRADIEAAYNIKE